MQTMPLRGGLSFKFTLLTTALIVLTSTLSSFFFLKSKRSDYLEFLKERGASLSRTLAFNSEYAILSQDQDALLKLTRAILQDPDIAYCVVHDSRGEVLVEQYKENFLKKSLSAEMTSHATQLTLGKTETLIQPDMSDPSPPFFDIATLVKTKRLSDTSKKTDLLRIYLGILDQIKKTFNVEAVVIEEKIGTVRVGISTENLKISMQKITKAIGMITLIICLIGILLTVILVQFIILPIRRLVYGTRQIARGDFNHGVNVQSRDEIGVLAASFNQMTSHLKKSHDQVEKYQHNLEQMVEERTRKLQQTEAELIRSEKFAAIGELITGITHELNNKLTPILGYIQIFKTMNLDPKIANHLDIIEESAYNAKKIVESLLKFSRTAPPQKVLTNLNKTMQDMLALIEPHIKKHNIRLKVSLDLQLPATLVDPGLMGQAFLNILNNAWQAMEEKGGILTVQSFFKLRRIHFVIQDTGPGIAKENLTRIFDPFFTTKEVGKGTGLGLSITYGIIQKHQGDIHVESKIGTGSSFNIELPLAIPEEPLEKQKGPEQGSLKVLVLENDDFVKSVLQTTAISYEMDFATQMDEARNILRHRSYDLYLLDWQLSETGTSLYQWMETFCPEELSKVIWTVQDSNHKRTQIFLSKTSQPYLTKPFRLEDLMSAVHKIVTHPLG